MNGTQQRAHRTAVLDANARIDDLVTVAEGLDAGIVGVAKAVGDERAHRLQLAKEQRDYVDQADKTLDVMIRALRDRSLLGRLRWLVRGI